MTNMPPEYRADVDRVRTYLVHALKGEHIAVGIPACMETVFTSTMQVAGDEKDTALALVTSLRDMVDHIEQTIRGTH